MTITPTTILCTVADLRPAVTAAASVVQRWNTIPIIGCLRITPKAGKLIIEGTNLDTWMRVECAADAVEGQPFMVRAELLTGLLSGALQNDDVYIYRAADVLTIQIGPATSRIRDLMPADDWPEPPSFVGAPYSIPEAVLSRIISSVSFAISTEETRYYLNGIYLYPTDDGRLAGCATDGHRLALLKTHEAWASDGVILPHPAVSQLRRRLVKGGNRMVGITVDPSNHKMGFIGDGWSMVCKTIDGTYPDFNRVIPPRQPDASYACLSRETMRRFPAKLMPVGISLRLDLTAKTASISDRSEGLETSLPIEARGDFAIGFNVRYIRDLAHRFGTLKIEATSQSDAAHVLTEDPDLTVVVMPMRMV